MKILVTGFDAFGGDTVNPAQELLAVLPGQVAGAEICKLLVPTVFHEAARYLQEAMDIYHPEIILAIGQAGGRAAISVERIAINVDDARIADNQGQQPLDQPIRFDGPAAYFSTLPVKALVAAIRQAGYPASLSNSAGTFVCNHLMYQALYLCDKFYPGTKAGFIHIPYLPEQVINQPGQPSMTLEAIQAGFLAVLETLATRQKSGDVAAVEGTLH